MPPSTTQVLDRGGSSEAVDVDALAAGEDGQVVQHRVRGSLDRHRVPASATDGDPVDLDPSTVDDPQRRAFVGADRQRQLSRVGCAAVVRDPPTGVRGVSEPDPDVAVRVLPDPGTQVGPGPTRQLRVPRVLRHRAGGITGRELGRHRPELLVVGEQVLRVSVRDQPHVARREPGPLRQGEECSPRDSLLQPVAGHPHVGVALLEPVIVARLPEHLALALAECVDSTVDDDDVVLVVRAEMDGLAGVVRVGAALASDAYALDVGACPDPQGVAGAQRVDAALDGGERVLQRQPVVVVVASEAGEEAHGVTSSPSPSRPATAQST